MNLIVAGIYHFSTTNKSVSSSAGFQTVVGITTKDWHGANPGFNVKNHSQTSIWMYLKAIFNFFIQSGKFIYSVFYATLINFNFFI